MTQTGIIHCGTTWPAGSKFCGKCRAPLGATATPAGVAVAVVGTSGGSASPVSASAVTSTVTGGTRWSRPHGVMAQRVEVPDLKALLAKHLDIEEGTRGLLFQHGKFVGTLDPGRHTVATVTDRLKSLIFGQPAFAVVMDAGVLRLNVSCPGLLSQDSHEINVSARFALSLADPSAFFVNVMKGDQLVRTDSVVELFQASILNVMQRVVRESSLDDLAHDDELVERLDDDLREALQAQLKDIGLTFLRVDHARFDCPARESIQRQHAQVNFVEAELKLRERRRKVQHQIDAEATDDRIAKIETERDLREFMATIEAKAVEDGKRRDFAAKKTDLERQQHWEVLWNDFATLKEDLAGKREFLKAQAEADYRRQLAELERREQVDRLVHDHSLSDTVLNHQLQQSQTQLDARLVQEAQKFESELSIALKSAESASDIRDIRRRQEEEDAASELQRREARHQLQIKRAKDAIELNSLYQQTELNRTAKTQDMDLAKKSAELDLTLRSTSAEHGQKLEYLRALNEAKTEVLVAVSNPKEAALLAEQLKLQAMQNLTAEQIAAINAAQNPALAQALVAKFQADAAVQAQAGKASQDQTERLLAQQQEASAQVQAAMQQALGRAERMNEVALTTQRATAVAAASGGKPSSSADGTEVVKVRCPNANCGKLNGPEMKYCSDCGTNLKPTY